MSYTTLANVKLHMGITTTDQDALLTVLIDEAKATIDDYCHTTFEVTADSTRSFDPTRDVEGRMLYLDGWLCGVTSVVNGDGSTVAATNYVTEPRNDSPWYALTLKQNSSVMWTYTSTPEKAIAIAGKWAYSITAPLTVTKVANQLVELAYNSQGKGGFSKMDVEDLSVTLAGTGQAAAADILVALNPYRSLV